MRIQSSHLIRVLIIRNRTISEVVITPKRYFKI